jgi:hypothetical protein
MTDFYENDSEPFDSVNKEALSVSPPRSLLQGNSNGKPVTGNLHWLLYPRLLCACVPVGDRCVPARNKNRGRVQALATVRSAQPYRPHLDWLTERWLTGLGGTTQMKVARGARHTLAVCLAHNQRAINKPPHTGIYNPSCIRLVGEMQQICVYCYVLWRTVPATNLHAYIPA